MNTRLLSPASELIERGLSFAVATVVRRQAPSDDAAAADAAADDVEPVCGSGT